MKHELKCCSDIFDDINQGKRKFDFRYSDRNYHEGDILILKEVNTPDTGTYTGRQMEVLVTSCTFIHAVITSAGSEFKPCVIMSIQKL